MAARDTPATTAARKAGIEFSVHEYEHDPGASSYGMEAAAAPGARSHARVQDARRRPRRHADGVHRAGGERARPALARKARRPPRPGEGGADDRLRRGRDQPARPAPRAADARRRDGARARHGLRERGAARPGDRARPAGPRRAHARDGAPAAALTQAVCSPRGRAQAVSAASAARATPVEKRVGAGRQCGRAGRRSPSTSWSSPRASTTAQVRAESRAAASNTGPPGTARRRKPTGSPSAVAYSAAEIRARRWWRAAISRALVAVSI